MIILRAPTYFVVFDIDGDVDGVVVVTDDDDDDAAAAAAIFCKFSCCFLSLY
jgi:hypothetical protein